ncbi:sensor histidine kinase [Streptomonospora litoralis]|uniref:Sensor histidine kinase DesK n=1 Tax=Streptomonospora litoralis TaxID=2498135 RepID=A0A4P6Q162_9ACTN|nr:sensor histidine kinase [Streptomonospora litoralis]QBI52317.1 Sensor histidine kinase DesK [Streptomonospora litoralis]
MAANDIPVQAPADRMGYRLNRARRIVLLLSLSTPVFCVLTALVAVAESASRPERMAAYAGRVPGALGDGLTVAGVLCSVVLAYFSMRVIRTRIDRPSTTLRRDVTLSALALLATTGLLGPNPFALSAAQFWGASVAITGRFRSKAAYVVLMLVAGVAPVVVELWNGPLQAMVLVVIILAGIQLVVWLVMVGSNAAFVLLWDVVTEAYAARDAQTRLAVSEERLRFSRDMHDLLGHSLSALAVKSELSARLAGIDPQGAAREMTAVQHLARDALREVRSAVSGYRDVDLVAETASVQAVLTAAGVRCTVTGADADLPVEQRAIASWVVREGTTNVLRHSTAKHCAVTLRRDAGTLVIEIFNDGVHGQSGGSVPFGNGLSGLAERVAAAGGALTTGLVSGGEGFLLRAVLPLPAQPSAPELQQPAADPGREDVTA